MASLDQASFVQSARILSKHSSGRTGDADDPVRGIVREDLLVAISPIVEESAGLSPARVPHHDVRTLVFIDVGKVNKYLQELHVVHVEMVKLGRL